MMSVGVEMGIELGRSGRDGVVVLRRDRKELILFLFLFGIAFILDWPEGCSFEVSGSQFSGSREWGMLKRFDSC